MQSVSSSSLLLSSLEVGNTKVYAPEIRARLGTAGAVGEEPTKHRDGQGEERQPRAPRKGHIPLGPLKQLHGRHHNLQGQPYPAVEFVPKKSI